MDWKRSLTGSVYFCHLNHLFNRTANTAGTMLNNEMHEVLDLFILDFWKAHIVWLAQKLWKTKI